MIPCLLLILPDRPVGHPGEPCADPNCPFRKPIEPGSTRPAGPSGFEEQIQAAVAQFRRKVLDGQSPAYNSRPSEQWGPTHSPGAKAAYVRQEAAKPPEREHFCHVPECRTPCAPAHLMCGPHWRQVPKRLQRALVQAGNASTLRGEAEVKTAYLDAADAAIAAVIKANPQRKLF